jgi:hypothetical protein
VNLREWFQKVHNCRDLLQGDGTLCGEVNSKTPQPMPAFVVASHHHRPQVRSVCAPQPPPLAQGCSLVSENSIGELMPCISGGDPGMWFVF